MSKLTAVIVSVEYGDILRHALPYNRHHFDRVVVVTARHDAETQAVARDNGADCLVTSVFYERGAHFNKGAALERGFEFAGRSDWFVVLDADVLIPKDAALRGPWRFIGCLYTPTRRMARDLSQVELLASGDEREWLAFAANEREEHAGYFQMFHAEDSGLDALPWYPTNWRHAGGCDSEFAKRWPRSLQRRPPFSVLHLGEDSVNWHGRCTMRTDGTMPPGHETRSFNQYTTFANRADAKSTNPAGRLRFASEKIDGNDDTEGR